MLTILIIDVPEAKTLRNAIESIEEKTDLSKINFTAVGIPSPPTQPNADWVKPERTPAKNIAITIKRLYGIDQARPDEPRPKRQNNDDNRYSIHPNVMPEGNDRYVFSGEIAGVTCRLYITDPHAHGRATHVESLKHVLLALHAANLITDPPAD